MFVFACVELFARLSQNAKKTGRGMPVAVLGREVEVPEGSSEEVPKVI
jgi:hypothetical protein